MILGSQAMRGRYCRPCDVYSDFGQPCWICGSTDLEQVWAPGATNPFRYDPARAVEIGMEDA